MKVKIVGKNISVTQALEDIITKKVSQLDKYFLISEDDTAKVLLRTYPHSQKIEITIPTKYAILRTETSNADMYAAIDQAIEKLKDQIRRQKTRIQNKKGKPLYEAFLDMDIAPEGDPEELVKTKTVQLKKMSLDEAIIQMELLDHSFFIYLDDETEKPAVVYIRQDGDYGCIETE